MNRRGLYFRPFVVLLFLGASGCGDAESTSRLRVQHSDDGELVRVTADWSYRSGEVDVDLTLETEYPEEGCVTTARLWVNKATETANTYHLEPTDCSVLALTEEGDIVLRESPTSHDWSNEELFVDTDRERLELGPWRAPGGISYRFSLESPACSNDCECPLLTRRAGAQASSLDLGRTCD